MNSPWPEALAIFGVLIAFWVWADWNYNRKQANVSERRTDITQSEFVTMLADDCDPETARWLWSKVVTHSKLPAIHPNDDINDDLDIDTDYCVEWFTEYLESRSANIDDWPVYWPIGTPLTVQNFARSLAKKPPIEAEG